MLFVSSGLALLVGAALGALGGGGSLLMLPILVYVAGMKPLAAVPLSLLVVAATSVVALVPHARAGHVQWRVGLLFGLTGMGGAYVGGRLSPLLPAPLLLAGFAGLMLATALSLFRGKSDPERQAQLNLGQALVMGAAVGCVSGLVGAGGGFLVVPALVLSSGMTTRHAIATSLLVVALQSVAGFAAQLHQAPFDWTLAACATGAAVLGSVAGAHESRRLPQAKLRRAFAWLVLALGAVILSKQLAHLLNPTAVAALCGGVLIGGAAALLWLLLGRVAGISGIVGGLIGARPGDRSWRLLFLLGLLVGGAVTSRLMPTAFGPAPVPVGWVAAAGLLVGVGTTLANGCTSGHGVCGVGKLSQRSIIATLSFITAGCLTVYCVRHLLGSFG